MNNWSKIIVQAVAVVALLILVIIIYGLVTSPTSHEDILTKIDALNRNQIAICSQLGLICE